MSYFWKYFSKEGREQRKEKAIQVDNELREIQKDIKLEKGDTLAIIIAALTTLLPYCIIGMALFVFLILLIFQAF